MPFFSRQDGGKIHYEIIPGILPQSTLFIHGNMASMRWWYPARDVWQNQFSNQPGDMILVEFPGCGQSTPLKKDEAVDLQNFANEFLRLLSELKVSNLNIVGHSTGAAIAALMLADAPELFAKGILVDPVPPKGFRVPRGLEEIYAKMALDPELLAKILGTAVYAIEDKKFFQEVLVADAMLAVKNVGFSVMRALSTLNIEEKCRNIQHSLIVLHGEHDITTPLPAAQAWISILPQAFLKKMKDVGHSPNVEKPIEFVSELNEFFAFGQ